MSERNPNENPDENEALEVALTPEIAEKISEKAIDINAKGYGYTVLNAFSDNGARNLESVLRNGLLGTGADDYKEASLLGGAATKESWVEHAREGKETNFYFNITGRGGLTFQYPGEELDVKNSEHFGYSGEKTALIFDLSGFMEEEPSSKPFTPGTRKFRVDDPKFNDPEDWKYLTNAFDKEGLPKPSTKYGFIGSRRVPPRLFKALVYKFREPNKLMEVIRRNKLQQEILKKMGQAVLSSFPTPEDGIPIYDEHGNMIWPKSIPRKEILARSERSIK
ncbi:MAG: hypothetical protein LiPW15_195 [Parcubacteria group bacterium LiPW_15]|nr:MAG: hypothetical protein LiPW15_195 [Parcubacteria group bacterium LiPW_15]